MLITLNEAILDLQTKGLPYPSAFSVFFLYKRIGDLFDKDDDFDDNFNELVGLQKTIQWYQSQ